MERQPQWYHFKITTVWLKFLSFNGTVIQIGKLPFPDIFKHFFIFNNNYFQKEIAHKLCTNLKSTFLKFSYKSSERDVPISSIKNHSADPFCWQELTISWIEWEDDWSHLSLCAKWATVKTVHLPNLETMVLSRAWTGALKSCREAWWGPPSFPLLPKTGCQKGQLWRHLQDSGVRPSQDYE